MWVPDSKHISLKGRNVWLFSDPAIERKELVGLGGVLDKKERWQERKLRQGRSRPKAVSRTLWPPLPQAHTLLVPRDTCVSCAKLAIALSKLALGLALTAAWEGERGSLGAEEPPSLSFLSLLSFSHPTPPLSFQCNTSHILIFVYLHWAMCGISLAANSHAPDRVPFFWAAFLRVVRGWFSVALKGLRFLCVY